MRFFFCVDNSFKSWIKCILENFNVDKTLKFNIPYPILLKSIPYSPFVLCIIIKINLPCSLLTLNRATNGRPYTHITYQHTRLALMGAVAPRLRGTLIYVILSRQPMVTTTPHTTYKQQSSPAP